MTTARFAAFTVADWVAYTQTRHWRTIDMTLARIGAVWQALGGPCSGAKIIVAGTNGKGSTVALMEAMFLAAGVRTGAYTSPHLVTFNERVRIAGKNATDADICAAFQAIEAARGDIPLTYFEFATLCALWLFEHHEVAVNLLEVGLGGRLDAVNMVDGDIAVITRIGLDHQAWLGSDRESIAKEKAGIIRPGKPVVCSDPAMPDAIAAQADLGGSPLLRIGTEFSVMQHAQGWDWRAEHPLLPPHWRQLSGLPLPLAGAHQGDNLGGAVAAVALVADSFGLSPAHARAGLAQVQLKARCQVVGRQPLVIIDVAHNADSAMELANFVARHPVTGKTLAVFGVLADKDLEAIARPLYGMIDRWFVAGIEEARGQGGDALVARLRARYPDIAAQGYANPVAAWDLARSVLNPEDRAIIFGSFHITGDIIAADKGPTGPNLFSL